MPDEKNSTFVDQFDVTEIVKRPEFHLAVRAALGAFLAVLSPDGNARPAEVVALGAEITALGARGAEEVAARQRIAKMREEAFGRP